MGHIFLPPPLAWGFLLPNPDGSLGAHVPFLSWRLHSRTSPAFCADLGASLGVAGWVRAEVQKEGAPHEGRAAGGGWGDGLWEGCFPRGSRGSFTGHRDGALEHWLAARPQWVTILAYLRAVVVGLPFLDGSRDGTEEHLFFLSGG